MRLSAILALLALSGCAGPVTRDAVLAPYLDMPSTCEAIEAEMLALAEPDAKVLSARSIKEPVALSVGLAAAAGTLPTGFAWAPAGAAAAQAIRLPTHEKRLDLLAITHSVRGCHPLQLPKPELQQKASPGAAPDTSYLEGLQ